jgi:hypothetical protein
MNLDLTDALILILAAYRLTRLITTDTLLERLRECWWRRFPPSTQLGYLITCDWCTSVWISAPLVLMYSIYPTATIYACATFALSAAVGIMAALVR